MNPKDEEKPLVQTAETTSYEARMSFLDVEMLYRSMLIRITKKLSTEEMSFLIGEERGFIGEIEKLQHVGYRMNILWKKHWLVSEVGTTFLFPNHPVEEKLNNYQLIKSAYLDKTLYQMIQLCEDGKKETVFVLKDDNHTMDRYSESTKREQDFLRTAIQALLDLDYFDKEKSPYQLFLRCQSLMYDHIKPKNLCQILTTFTKQKQYPRLKRIKSKYSGYEYIIIRKPENIT